MGGKLSTVRLSQEAVAFAARIAHCVSVCVCATIVQIVSASRKTRCLCRCLCLNPPTKHILHLRNPCRSIPVCASVPQWIALYCWSLGHHPSHLCLALDWEVENLGVVQTLTPVTTLFQFLTNLLVVQEFLRARCIQSQASCIYSLCMYIPRTPGNTHTGFAAFIISEQSYMAEFPFLAPPPPLTTSRCSAGYTVLKRGACFLCFWINQSAHENHPQRYGSTGCTRRLPRILPARRFRHKPTPSRLAVNLSQAHHVQAGGRARVHQRRRPRI